MDEAKSDQTKSDQTKPDQTKPDQTKTEEAKPDETKKPEQAKPADKPATPAAAENLSGSIDFGYRWIPNSNGNVNVYRSIINLGEGPKLFGADLSYRPQKNKLFDRLDVSATSWGGEPYNSARLHMTRAGAYDFTMNYRKMDYFNNLPSFANPELAQGATNSQNARDTERRLFDAQLDMLPNSKFSPFIAWSRDAGDGPGLTNFANISDKFTSNTIFNDAQDVFRGGTHFNSGNFHMTLEAGGVWFRDGQQVLYNGATGAPNYGNVTVPLLGVSQYATADSQNYDATGSSFFTQASVVWTPYSALTFTGQFSFSQPSLNLVYGESSAGNLLLMSQLLAYSGESATATGSVLRPHPSGNMGMDWRPIPKLRILQSWYTDRYHVVSNALFTQTLTGVVGVFGGGPQANYTTVTPSEAFLVSVYNRYQGEAFYDVTSRVTLRAGFRQEWADAEVPAPVLVFNGSPEIGTERHGTVLSGIDVRLFKGFTAMAEGEASVGSGSVFFRTGLPDSNKFKTRLRYTPLASLSLNLVQTWLSGSNSLPGVNSTYSARQTSGSLIFAPREGKRISLSLDYMNSATDSRIPILDPPFYTPDASLYAMHANTAGAWVDLALLHGARFEFRGIADAEQRIAAHQFLSAARAAVRAPSSTRHLEHGMGLLWLPGNFISIGKLQLPPVLHRTKVALMKSSLVAGLFLAGVVWASVAAAQAPGDARRGGLVLRQADCLDCHTFEGAGKGTAPDLGRRTADAFTRTQFAALMWNHAPQMWGMMHQSGKAVPALSVEQVGDLFAHFYSARFFEPTGDAARGKRLFNERRCSVCHDLRAPKVGPPVAEWKEVSDPAAWIRQMWNHSGVMYAKAKEMKIAWPNLTAQEFSDLLVYLKSLPETRSAKAEFSVSDPQEGKNLFDKKGCTRCHVIHGAEAGKISIPVNGRPADSLAAVAAMMWDHAPSMNESSKGDLPHFEGAEMNHVLAYLFWSGFFEEPGDPRAGQRVYEKKCAECHAKGVAGAPDLAFLRSRPGAAGERGVSAISITSALWKHGPGMLAALKSRGREWPVFQGSEMADLIAYLNQK